MVVCGWVGSSNEGKVALAEHDGGDVVGRGVVIFVPGEVEQRPRRELGLAGTHVGSNEVASVANVGVVAVVVDVRNIIHVLRKRSRQICIKLAGLDDVCAPDRVAMDVVVRDERSVLAVVVAHLCGGVAVARKILGINFPRDALAVKKISDVGGVDVDVVVVGGEGVAAGHSDVVGL